MSGGTIWTVVVAIGAGTVALKAAGPLILGERPLPEPVRRVVALLAPALLAALVATSTFGGDGVLELDARVAGLGAAAIALLLRAPTLLVVVVAAVAAAGARLAGLD